MSRQTRIRLFSLLMLLGVLAGILVTPAEQNAYAATCCTSCDYQMDSCLAGTMYPWCYGDLKCCEKAVAHCYSLCNWSC